jgi:catechol 2,3-dioxygenase-like lactoylglutathione lyase family enzyme
MRGTIHHIDLTVSDLIVSAVFYETVLGFLGYRRTSTRPDYVDWNLPGGDGLLCSIGLKAARSDRQHDRYSVGLHYLAWHAVDRVFFADPDGLKLEFVHYPGEP